MTPQQVYIDALLDAVANEPFPSDEQREVLVRVKEHLASAADLGEELKRLYAVDRFSEFALALMWAERQAEREPERSEPSADDQYLVSMKFRGAFAEEEQSEARPAAEPIEEPVASDDVSQEVPPEPEAPTGPPVAFDPTAPEDTFPQLLDKFVVAMQAGVDDRNRLFDKVMNSASEIGQPESDYSSDLQEFCAKLVEFLSYAKRSEYMDDVRTLNILSAISDAMSTWSAASIETRSGLLADGTKTLAEARSHFE